MKALPNWLRVKQSEVNSGQALLIIAISMVALIGLIGLAIDGGRLLVLRRDAQNAADAAALASSYALCSGGTVAQVQSAGLAAASANGFQTEDGTTVTVRTPPLNAPDNTCEECAVEVVIQRQIPGYFSRVVFQGELEVTTSAMGLCNPDSNRFGSNSDEEARPDLTTLFAGSTQCNNSLKWSGATNTIVGGVHSNNDIQVGGSSNNVYGDSSYVTTLDGGADKVQWHDWEDAPGDYEDPDDDLVCGASCTVFDNGEDSGNPANLTNPYGTDDDPLYPIEFDINDYRPGGRAALEAQADSGAVYAVFSCKNQNDSMDMSWLEDNGYWDDTTHTLQDGLYYSPCGILINDNDLHGNITLVAETDIDISGSKHTINPYIDDLLAFSNLARGGTDQCSSTAIKFSGSSHNWTGMIFAPTGNVQMAASSNSALHGCIIAYTIDIPGSELFIACEPTDSEEEPEISLLQ